MPSNWRRCGLPKRGHYGMFHNVCESRKASITSSGCSMIFRLQERPHTRLRTNRVIMATDYRIPGNKLVRPDKDRFLNEENPFEAMMSRFDKAAELLDLEPGMYKVLRQAEKQVIVSIPVMMDNGQIEVFEGYRVLYNTSRGPAKGGIRFDTQVTLEEVKALAADDVEVRRREYSIRWRERRRQV